MDRLKLFNKGRFWIILGVSLLLVGFFIYSINYSSFIEIIFIIFGEIVLLSAWLFRDKLEWSGKKAKSDTIEMELTFSKTISIPIYLLLFLFVSSGYVDMFHDYRSREYLDLCTSGNCDYFLFAFMIHVAILVSSILYIFHHYTIRRVMWREVGRDSIGRKEYLDELS